MKKLVTAILSVALAGLALTAINVQAQKQIEGTAVSPAAIPTGYFSINGTGAVGTWSLDSAQLDTSAAYPVVPGSFCAISVSVAATTDTIDQLYIYGSMTGQTADWVLLDSTGAIDGEDGPIEEMRYIHGPANGSVGAATPIVCRYLHFTAQNHDGANAASANVVTAYLTTSRP